MEEQISKMMEMMTKMAQQQEATAAELATLKEGAEAQRQPSSASAQRPTGNAGDLRGSTSFRPRVDPPPKFPGREEEWRMFSMKMRSYYGNALDGEMGEWMDIVKEHRESDCRVDALGAEAKNAAEMLYQGLIAFCEGDSFTIVENAGEGEGLEAWRALYQRYDAQTRQSRVAQLMRLLDTEVKKDDLMNCLAKFERDWQRWESRSKQDWDELVNDLKIGVVLKGLEPGPEKTQLLLESEKCLTYANFRSQVETIARASRAGGGQTSVEQLQAQLEAFKGGKGGKASGKGAFDGKCNNCGKPGHKKGDCYKPGGGAYKPGGKGGGKSGGKTPGKATGKGDRACFECGMTNHMAKDCRASEERKRKYKESLKRAQELAPALEAEQLGHLCELGGDRQDQSDRHIVFNVDSGASRTVVSPKHKAVRGYRIHKDAQTGIPYNTAGKQQIQDEGQRVLQIKAVPGDKPWRMNTRVADVRNSLLSPSEMAKCGHDVLLRNEDGYAIHRQTGVTHKFERTPGGWQFKVELEAPDVANKVWELHRLAELKPKEDDWKAKASTALKEMLGMAGKSDEQLNENMHAFVDAFARLDNAKEGLDPTIYPFTRRR